MPIIFEAWRSLCAAQNAERCGNGGGGIEFSGGGKPDVGSDEGEGRGVEAGRALCAEMWAFRVASRELIDIDDFSS